MRMRATHQRRVQETWQLDIVHKTPATTQQARIFDACYRSAKIPCAHIVSFARSAIPMAHAVGPIAYGALLLYANRQLLCHYFFWVGTGRPGIFTLTAPKWVRLV